MSNPVIVTGCLEPIYGVAVTSSIACPPFYYNAQLILNCPVNFHGGPFTCPPGKFTSIISQADADAQAMAYLQNVLNLNCVSNIPVVSSGSLTIAPSGAVSYQIVATNAPTSYGSGTLPGTLSLNSSTGLITGNVPATITTYTIPISATNAAGTGNGLLVITVKPRLQFTIGSTTASVLPASQLMVSVDGSTPTPITTGQIFTFLSQLIISISNTSSPSGFSNSNRNFSLVPLDFNSIILPGSSNNISMGFVPSGGSASMQMTILNGITPVSPYSLSQNSSISPLTASATGLIGVALNQGTTYAMEWQATNPGGNTTSMTVSTNLILNF